MKRLLFGTLGVGGVAVLGLGGWLGSTVASWPPSFPDTPYPDVSASAEPEVIAQGEYLFHAVAHCSVCHAASMEVLEQVTDTPPDPIGGLEFAMGPLGTLYSKNLTPAGVAAEYSDAELARVILTGVNRHHEPAALMISVGAMADEDLTAIVSYIRSLEPIAHEPPPTEVSAFGKLLLSTVVKGLVAPKEHEPPPYVPPGEISVERGSYLANGPATCYACHSEADISERFAIVEPRFAGNPEPDPAHGDETKEIVSPNLTPHPSGRLLAYTEDRWVEKFRSGKGMPGSKMPWVAYQFMTEADLRSIYRYLHTLEPVDRDVGPTYRDAGWSPE